MTLHMDMNFDVMNEDLRVGLIDTHMREALDSDWTDTEITAGLQAIVRVADGTNLDVEVPEDVEDEDLTDVQLVRRMISFYMGS